MSNQHGTLDALCRIPHPLTPREKVELKPCPFCASRNLAFTAPCSGGGIGVLCRACHTNMDSRCESEDGAAEKWNRRAALASSGDHAELARLAEWRDRLRADPGRAAHFGSPYADKPMHNGRTYWNSDLAEDITTLIAEVAALRGERDAYFGMANRSEDAWLKAERKLAEAMGLHERAAELMRQCTDPERFEGVSTLNVYANMRAWLSDLSKEAERG